MQNELTSHTVLSDGAALALFAEVIVPLALPINYTWQVPEKWRGGISVGCRVEVNLGKSKKYAGIVKALHHEAPQLFEPKEILNVLDAQPVVNLQQLQLWQWIAAYYMCTEGEVMAAALPAHFKLNSETILVFNEEAGDDFTELDNEEYLVAEALQIKKELRVSEVQQILDVAHVYPVINKLIKKKIGYVWEALKETYTPKKETYIHLHPAYENEAALEQLLNADKRLQRAEKQLELLLAFLFLQKKESEITKPALLKKSNASDAQLKGLLDKGILIAKSRSVDRIKQLPATVEINFELSAPQAEALSAIAAAFQQKNICLLHGVTSSGKTEIYIRLIEACLNAGTQILYMLPEIALTSQTTRRLQKHFGGHIAVYHSKFSQNERIEIWNKVKNGEVKIILGARSALFLPFDTLSLIICDEEHDASYKQIEPAPRYHARDTAIYMASLYKECKVLLGSATPSLESYHNAVQGKYGLASLTTRYGDVQMPPLEMIDTRRYNHKANEPNIITPPLKEAIQSAIDHQKQVILFQNRRGYTPFQCCSTCGWIPQCRHCDVSLTYHKYKNKLACHYCGTTYPPLHICAACGSHHFVQKQFGTERIEELLQEAFPDAATGRMDVDSVRGKNAHDQLIQAFEQKKINILVGTQMVVKGLDFENVGLVGILDADGILSFTDFRVNERAFQLMEQVSGRAGRKRNDGKVLVQTAHPTHPILMQVQQHHYLAMYEMEIDRRSQFYYPPFSRIIKLTIRHKIKNIVQEAAQHFVNALPNPYRQYITGPAEPIVNRVRNQYLMEVLLKLPKSTQMLAQCKKDILNQIALLHQHKNFKSVVIIADVDGV